MFGISCSSENDGNSKLAVMFLFQRENAEGEGSEGNEPDDEDNEGMENLIKNKMNSTDVLKLHCHNIPNSAAS